MKIKVAHSVIVVGMLAYGMVYWNRSADLELSNESVDSRNEVNIQDSMLADTTRETPIVSGSEFLPYTLELNSALSYPYDSTSKWIDAVAKLGPNAIPAIEARLLENENGVSLVLIQALGEIGHSDGVAPLLKYLDTFDLPVDHPLLRVAIESLGNIGDPKAEPALLEVFNLPGVDMRTQIVSARSLLLAGSDETKNIVESSLFDLYERKEEFYESQDYYFVEDLQKAIATLDSDKAIEITKQTLGPEVQARVALDVFDTLSMKDDESALLIMFEFANRNDGTDPSVQLYALEKIASVGYSDYVSPRAILGRLNELSANGDIPSFTDTTLERLRENITNEIR